VDDDVGSVYAGSDGRFYTDWQVDRKLRQGAWRPCVHDRGTDRRMVGTDDGELVLLVSVEAAELPEWVRIRADPGGLRVVDTRRVAPF